MAVKIINPNQSKGTTFNPNLAKPGQCPHCGFEFFQSSIRILIVPGIANSTGKEIGVPQEYLLCLDCGTSSLRGELVTDFDEDERKEL